MDSLDNHGIILRELRRRNGLSIQKAAKMIHKSAGWLCEVENADGTCRLTTTEFDRIVTILGGSNERHMFKTWIANHKNQANVSKLFDGAVIKFIRIKKGISLSQAARRVGLSKGYLSKLETGAAPMTLERRVKLMRAYGYNPSSFKNLSSDPVRSKAVPLRFKFDILMQKISADVADAIFKSALTNHL